MPVRPLSSAWCLPNRYATGWVISLAALAGERAEVRRFFFFKFGLERFTISETNYFTKRF
jgi:hypothetical protein